MSRGAGRCALSARVPLTSRLAPRFHTRIGSLSSSIGVVCGRHAGTRCSRRPLPARCAPRIGKHRRGPSVRRHFLVCMRDRSWRLTRTFVAPALSLAMLCVNVEDGGVLVSLLVCERRANRVAFPAVTRRSSAAPSEGRQARAGPGRQERTRGARLG